MLFAFTLVAQERIVDVDDDPDLVVDVTGFEWSWQFDYPDDGVTVTGTPEQPPELVLPVGRTVRMNLRTEDVIHSFWVPEFLGKRDLIPRVDNEIDVTSPRKGTWTGRCAEYCGLDHWRDELLGPGRESGRVRRLARRGRRGGPADIGSLESTLTGPGRPHTACVAGERRTQRPSSPGSCAGSPARTTRRSASATW